MTKAATLQLKTADNDRLTYLDNLKISLTALVICHHVACAHGASGGWYYKIPPPEGSIAPVLLTIFIAINQSFFMSLFFFVSAYFTPLSYDRKGPKFFLRDRFIRLGIPLVTYFFVLNPSIVYIVRRFRGMPVEAYPEFMIHNFIRYGETGPLWFVMSLLVFAVVYVLVRVLMQKRATEGRVLAPPTNAQIFAFVICIGLVTFLVRLLISASDDIFNLQLGNFPLYICMYIFGVWASRFSWLDELRAEQANRWFGVSMGLIAIMPPIMALGGALDGNTEVFMGGVNWQAYVYAAWEPFLCVGISMKLLSIFRKRLNSENVVTKTMSRSAYTAYIIHPFFVVCATYLFVGFPLDPLIKFLILCPITIISCFLVSNVIRKAPLLRRVL